MATAKRRILGRNALAITVSGPTAGAAQIFNYDMIREIRMDLEELDVKVLTTYDRDYLRVFKIENAEMLNEEQLKQARGQVLKFYNDLITASMKFSKEEIENLTKQQQALKEKMEAAQNGEAPAKEEATEAPAEENNNEEA
jgi:hypothetical protein